MAHKTVTTGNSLMYPLDVAELQIAVKDLQTKVTALATLANELKADKATLLAKLDADAGVTDTDYAATCATAAANVTI